MPNQISKNIIIILKKSIFFQLIITFILIYSCQNSKKENTSSINKDSLAIIELTEKIRSNAKNPQLFFDRSKANINLGNFNEAINDAELALKLDSINPEYYNAASGYYLLLGKSEKSKELLEKCIKFNPKNTDAMLKLANLHLYVKQYDKSMEYLKKAQEIDAQIPQIYFTKAIIALEMKDTTHAADNLYICIDKNPDYYEAYIQLGFIYAAKNDSLCIGFYNNAIRIKPKSAEAHYNLAMFYQEKHNFKKAIELYNSIINKIDENYADAYFNIAYINLNYLADYQKAIDYFSQSIEKKKNYYQAYYNRGFAYEKMNDFDLAKENYNNSLQIFPNYQLAIDGLNRIDLKRKKH